MWLSVKHRAGQDALNIAAINALLWGSHSVCVQKKRTLHTHTHTHYTRCTVPKSMSDCIRAAAFALTALRLPAKYKAGLQSCQIQNNSHLIWHSVEIHLLRQAWSDSWLHDERARVQKDQCAKLNVRDQRIFSHHRCFTLSLENNVNKNVSIIVLHLYIERNYYCYLCFTLDKGSQTSFG